MLTFNQISRSLVDEKNKIILVWIHKSGCTTAIKMLFRHMNILDESSKISQAAVHNYRTTTFVKNHGTCTISKFMDPKYRKIKIIRNPYARAVSSYLHCCRYAPEIVGNITFKEFLIKLISDRKSLTQILLQHCEIQYNGFVDSYVHIIKLESLSNEINNINTKYNTKFCLDGLEDSIHHNIKNKNIKIFVGNHTYQQIIKIGIPDYKMFYNEEIKKLVELIYGIDIQKYNYVF